MAGEFRYRPQETLNDVAALADTVLDPLLLVAPYLGLLLFIGGVPRALVQWRLESVRGRYLTIEQDLRLRTVPLSVGLWGLISMHALFIIMPRFTQILASHTGARATMEVITMGFAFFTLFGLLNLIVRHALEKDLRRKFSIPDIGIVTFVLLSLGVGTYAWATVRWASVWTGTLGWQHFVDAFTFSFEGYEAMKGLPVMAKLHVIVSSLAFGLLLHSRMLTHLMLPRPSLWRFASSALGMKKRVSAAEVASLAYGVTAVSKEEYSKEGSEGEYES